MTKQLYKFVPCVEATCKAIASGERIQLLIKKEDKGYEEFVKVLTDIKDYGCMSWYGDVRDETGKEQCGLVIKGKNQDSKKLEFAIGVMKFVIGELNALLRRKDVEKDEEVFEATVEFTVAALDLAIQEAEK